MKSLKRTLCLVLALVMVLGLFGVASAASFTDNAAIQYNEAVGVMTGIGAINGIGDGSFNPKGTITRAQAAKLVAYTILGSDVINTGTATSSFSDVPAAQYSWAIPSIEYLVQRGIINGRGDGTFDPNGNVTGYELGKMLLCSLGYGANGEYTGKGWDFQVAIDGNKNSEVIKVSTKTKLSVFAGKVGNSSLSAPATREEAALYCFNTIFLDQVTYNDVLKSYVSNKGFNLPATSIKDDVYPTLTGTVTTDTAGRPATKWTFKGQDVGTYEGAAAYVYTKSMKDAAGTKELTETFKNFTTPKTEQGADVGAELRINGIPQTTVKQTSDKTGLAEGIKALTGNGTVVQVFVNPAKLTEVTNISVLETELAQIENVNTVLKKVSLTTVNGGSLKADEDNPFYTLLASKAAGSYVIVRHLAGNVCYVAEPTVVTGKLTAIGTSTPGVVSVTLGGNTYPIAEKKATSVSGLTNTVLPAKTDSTLYLDTLGYAMHIKDVAATENYMYVANITNQSLVNGVLVHLVSGYTTDGTAVSLNVGTDAVTVALKDIVKYEPCDPATNNNAEYTVAKVTGIAKANKETTSGYAGKIAFTAANAVINATDMMFEGMSNDASSPDALSKIPYSPTVKFVFIDSTNKTVVARNGVQNVTAASTNSDVVGLYGKTADGTIVVTTVFVGKGDVGTGSNILFLNKATGYETVGNKSVFKYEAVIDGVKTAIMSTANKTSGVNKFYTYSVDKDTGLYNLGAAAYAETGKLTSVKIDKFSGLTLGHILDVTSVTGLEAKDAKVVDLTGKGLDTLTSIAQLKKGDSEQDIELAVVYDDMTGSPTKNTVKYVYVVSAAAKTYSVGFDTGGDAITAADKKGAYEATVTPSSAAKGATVTVKVKMTTAPTEKADIITLTGTGITPSGTLTFKIDDTPNKELEITFTMPGAAVSNLAITAAKAS